MIHRYVKALDLISVQIHGHDSVCTCSFQQIGDQFGRNGNPGLVFSVLTGIAKIGNNGCNVAGAGPLAASIISNNSRMLSDGPNVDEIKDISPLTDSLISMRISPSLKVRISQSQVGNHNNLKFFCEVFWSRSGKLNFISGIQTGFYLPSNVWKTTQNSLHPAPFICFHFKYDRIGHFICCFLINKRNALASRRIV